MYRYTSSFCYIRANCVLFRTMRSETPEVHSEMHPPHCLKAVVTSRTPDASTQRRMELRVQFGVLWTTPRWRQPSLVHYSNKYRLFRALWSVAMPLPCAQHQSKPRSANLRLSIKLEMRIMRGVLISLQLNVCLVAEPHCCLLESHTASPLWVTRRCIYSDQGCCAGTRRFCATCFNHTIRESPPLPMYD